MNIGLEISVPKEWWDDKKVLRAIESTLKKKTGPALSKDFKMTVRHWKHKPDFPKKFAKNSREMYIEVYPAGRNKDQYSFVHDGTAPRLIVPKPSRGPSARLRFKPGYSPSSSPGKIESGRARRTGSFVTAAYVRHPGIRARNFSNTIVNKEYGPFAVDINKAIFLALID